MRLFRVAGACLVTVLAIGMALASLADADAPNSGVSPLLAKELAVLTSQGIAPARAMHAIRVQGAVTQAGIVSKLEAALGNTYGGAWFEPAAAQVHIGVTSSAGRHAVEEVVAQEGLTPYVTTTTVRSTSEQLADTQHRWNGKLASLLARGQAETGLQFQHNAVIVTLSASVPSSELAALKHEASAADVNVLVSVVANNRLGVEAQANKTACKTWVAFKAYCNPSITPGVTIAKEKKPECTAGPVAINKNKERLLLTAGHCITAVGEKWSTFNKAEVESVIGPVQSFVFGGLATEKKGDYADMSIEPAWQTGKANNPVFAVTAEWKEMNNKKEETSYPVKTDKIPMEKMPSCHVGQASGESCGEIVAVNKTVNFGAGKVVEGLVEVKEPPEPEEELIGKGGDSGGPWLSIGANNEATMEGTHTGELFLCVKVAEVKVGAQFYKSQAECEKNENAGEGIWEHEKVSLIFFPLRNPAGLTEGSLQRLGLELLTTANEFIPAESTPLPDIHTALPGETYPLIVEGEAKQTVENDIALANSVSKVPAESTKVSLTITELSALGTAKIEFKGVHEKGAGEKCNTTGDAAGVVLVPSGEFHLVYTGLSPGSVLATAGLFLFPKFTILCGAVETTLESPSMARTMPVTEASGDSTTIEMASHCSNIATGTQELSSYYNSTLGLVEKQLLKMNIAGTGNMNACEEVKPTLLLKVATGSTTKMFSVDW